MRNVLFVTFPLLMIYSCLPLAAEGHPPPESPWMVKTFFGYGFWPGMLVHARDYGLDRPLEAAGGLSLGASTYYRVFRRLHLGAELAYAPIFHLDRDSYARAFFDSMGTVSFSSLSLSALGRLSLAFLYIEAGLDLNLIPTYVNVESGTFHLAGLPNGKTYVGPSLIIPWGAGLFKRPNIFLDIGFKGYNIVGNPVFEQYARTTEAPLYLSALISSLNIGAGFRF